MVRGIHDGEAQRSGMMMRTSGGIPEYLEELMMVVEHWKRKNGGTIHN